MFSKSLYLGITLSMLIGCGGSSSDAPPPQPPAPPPAASKITGVFLDDPVQGISYECSSGNSGTTNANGEYECDEGDTVTFLLGDIVLATVEASNNFVTPYDLFPNNLRAAINLARLLQTLDSDGDPANGTISLDQNLTMLLNVSVEDFSNRNFESIIEFQINIELIDSDIAQQRLNQNLSDNALPIPSYASDPVSENEILISNGLTYKVIKGATGRYWLDRNLGASRVCTDKLDVQCYGDYYQWGREADGHQLGNSELSSTQASTLNNINNFFIATPNDWTSEDTSGVIRQKIWLDDSTVYTDNVFLDGDESICPTGFRVPSSEELRNELLNVGVGDVNDAFTSFLKLPAAGFRDGKTGDILLTGSASQLWSISNSSSLTFFLGLYDLAEERGVFAIERSNGMPVRCIEKRSPSVNAGSDITATLGQDIDLSVKESSFGEDTIGTYTWFQGNTEIASGADLTLSNLELGEYEYTVVITNAIGERALDKIMVNVIEGEVIQFKGKTYETIISPRTGRVWLDRNLGAFRACQSNTDSDCYGDYYQFGRGSDGHEKIANSAVDRSIASSYISVPSSNIIIPLNEETLEFGKDWSTADYYLNLRADRFASPNAAICPICFRVPTEDELFRERNSFLNIPRAGWRIDTDGTRREVGNLGYLWTTTLSRDSDFISGDDPFFDEVKSAIAFTLDDDGGFFSAAKPVFATNIRCIKDDTPPIANAGGSFTVHASEDIILDGSLSSDDRGIVSYQWSVNGEFVSDSSIANLGQGDEGTVDVTLTVTDELGQTSQDNIVVRITNRTAQSVTDLSSNTYNEIISPYTGRKWLDRNMGANNACSAIDDQNCYGDLYQWGRNPDGHQNKTSSITTAKLSEFLANNSSAQFVIDSENSEPDWAASPLGDYARYDGWLNNRSNTCPEGYRAPTRQEFLAETIDSVDQPTTAVELYPTFLKLPKAGFRNGDNGSVSLENFRGYYWTADYGVKPVSLFFDDGEIAIEEIFDRWPTDGMSVRCTENTLGPTAQFNGITKIMPGGLLVLNANISNDPDGSIASYHWEIDGVVSSSDQVLSLTMPDVGNYSVSLTVTDNDGFQDTLTFTVSVTSETMVMHGGLYYEAIQSELSEKIWLDRNIGAQRACLSLNDEQCFGGYYQSGRGTDGHEKLNSETTTTQETSVINTSEKFVVDTDWISSAFNTERRENWAVLDGSSVCPANYRVASVDDIEPEFPGVIDDRFLATQDDAFYSVLRLPSAGLRRNETGNLSFTDTTYIWLLNDTILSASDNLQLNELTNYSNGRPVRCIYSPESYVYPQANAGLSQTVIEGTPVTLNASASNAGEAQIVEYEWTIDGEVVGTDIFVELAVLAIGEHKATLKVTDANGVSSYDRVDISVEELFTGEQYTPTITHQSFEYKTITSKHTGRIWLDRNIGAREVCDGTNTQECAGGYFQYGREMDGHQLADSQVYYFQWPNLNTSSPFVLLPSEATQLIRIGDNFRSFRPLKDWAELGVDDSLYDRTLRWSNTEGESICPAGFRVPTEEEFENEYSNVEGEPFNALNDLFMDATGHRDTEFRIYRLVEQDTIRLWTSSVSTGNWAVSPDIYWEDIEQDDLTYFELGLPREFVHDPTCSGDFCSYTYITDTVNAHPVRCIFDGDNAAPIADAGGNRAISVNNPSIIDGSGSNDDGRIVRYEWRDENGALISTQSGFPSSLLEEGVYTLTLTVTDNFLATASDTVVITIIDDNDGEELIVHNGVTYGVVTSPITGRDWLDRNIGASRVCISTDDPNCTGGYYQFGRPVDGHELPSSPEVLTPFDTLTPSSNEFVRYNSDWTTIDNNLNFRQNQWGSVLGNSICPPDFRLPSEFEFTEEVAGLNGDDQMFASFLKLGNAGRRFSNFEFNDSSFVPPGADTLYWTNSQEGVGLMSALYFNSSGETTFFLEPPTTGAVVRCISAF